MPLPEHFEAVAELVTENHVAESIVCGPDPQATSPPSGSTQAGYDHVCIHQVGKDQKGFFEFYADEILPHLTSIIAARRKTRGRRR